MLGLGLGVDYTLLLVTRFREARAAGHDPEAAAIEAATHAGHSVLVSAATVAVGFAALLAVPLADLRSIAAGGLLVVDDLRASRDDAGARRPRLARRARRARTRASALRVRSARRAGAAGRRSSRDIRCARCSSRCCRFSLLAVQARRLEPRLPRGDWLPRQAEAARGARTLRAMGSGGVVQTLRVVIVLPDRVHALDDARLGRDGATSRRRSCTIARVRRVRSLPGLTNGIDARLATVRVRPR